MAAFRTATKLLRFSPDELARITAHARSCGCTPALFIRETALGATRRVRPHADRDAVLREWARIASSLARLAAVCHQGDYSDVVAEQLLESLEAHQDALRSLVDDSKAPRRRTVPT